MPRTLVIPDIHHNTLVADEVLSRESYDAVVFLGDYFDSFNDSPEQAARTAEWLKAHVSDKRFTFLYGNHDLPYRFTTPGLDCSGYSVEKQRAILRVLGPDEWQDFRLHVWVDGWLLSHAGWNDSLLSGRVTRECIDELCAECLRDLDNGRMHRLVGAGASRGGREAIGGITWQDWRELQPISGLDQIVGHTPGLEVREKAVPGGRAICLDTRLCHVGYIEDGVLTTELTSVGRKWLGPGGRLASH